MNLNLAVSLPRFGILAASLSVTLLACAPADDESSPGEESAEADTAALVGVTVNPIDFMRNTSGFPTLRSSPGGGSIVSFHESGNRFFYVKSTDGLQWERYSHYGNFIRLERDTSWPTSDGHGNNAYDALPYGSLLWAKETGWTSGPANVISFKTTIAGYNYKSSAGATCRYDWEHPSVGDWGYQNEPSAQKWFDYVPAKCWGGDVGCVDSIGIHYNGGSETHWYARGLGWVAWEGPQGNVVWKFKSTTAYKPNDACSGLGTVPVNFRDLSTQRTGMYGEWDSCHGKGDCAIGETIAGISEVPGGHGRTALCRKGSGYTGTYRSTLTLDARTDVRRGKHVEEWASGYWKMECGLGEYVAAVSENALSCQGNNAFHAIICAAYSGPASTACNTQTFDGGDGRDGLISGGFTSGDWDVGAYKGECGLNQYVAGVSVDPNSGRPHSILCCNRN